MQKECTVWVEEIRKAIPSVLVRVIGENGCDVTGARFSIDNQPATAVDGRSVSIDPGVHVVRITAPERYATEQRVVLSEGERDRAVIVSFAAAGRKCGDPLTAPPPPPPRDPGRRLTPLVIGIGSFGLLASGVGAALEISSISQKPAFERCAPACDADEVSTWRTTWRVADVLVGVGVASLAVAAYLYFTGPSDDAKQASSHPFTFTF